MPVHTQVRITHGKRSAQVDEGLAEIIEGCWRLGAYTRSSCQGEPNGRAHIQFDGSESLSKFLVAVCGRFGDPIHDRIFGPDSIPDHWAFTVRPWDVGLEIVMREDGKQAFEAKADPIPIAPIVAKIPVSDLGIIAEALAVQVGADA